MQCLVDMLAQPVVYSLEHNIYMFIVNIMQEFYVVTLTGLFFKYIFFKIIEPYHELFNKTLIFYFSIFKKPYCLKIQQKNMY